MKSCEVTQGVLWLQRSLNMRRLLNKHAGPFFKISHIPQCTETKARCHEVRKNSNSHGMGTRSNTGWRNINNGHNT